MKKRKDYDETTPLNSDTRRPVTGWIIWFVLLIVLILWC